MDEILAYNDSENQVNVEDNEINREIIYMYNKIYNEECSNSMTKCINKIYNEAYHHVRYSNRKAILFLIIILYQYDVIKKEDFLKNVTKLIDKYIGLFRDNIHSAEYSDINDIKLSITFCVYLQKLINKADIYKIIDDSLN